MFLSYNIDVDNSLLQFLFDGYLYWKHRCNLFSIYMFQYISVFLASSLICKINDSINLLEYCTRYEFLESCNDNQMLSICHEMGYYINKRRTDLRHYYQILKSDVYKNNSPFVVLPKMHLNLRYWFIYLGYYSNGNTFLIINLDLRKSRILYIPQTIKSYIYIY